ncbi:MAG: T9SS type A sorting domain-containing protein [Bacteroidetes bacterium]|nr:T9SS type A sorting domain-containing protein [Bacteroidota bacterium]
MRAAVSVCILIFAATAASVFSPAKVPTPRRAGLSPADRVYYSAQFQLLRTRDPRTGMVPADIRGREYTYAATLPRATEDAAFMRRQQRSAFVPVWKQRGPTRVAGRMLDIVFDIENDNILYAGSASGGFWKSDDRGGSWRKTTAPTAEQTVSCIVQDSRPGMRDIMYYGTGELLSTTDRSIRTTARTTGYGNGIYRSSDRGESWTPLTSTLTTTQGRLVSPFQGVWDLAIASDGWDAGALYAACYGQILRSRDNGESWEHVLGDASNPSFSTDIVLTPVLSYAAIGGFSVAAGVPSQRGVFFSTDRRDWFDITPAGFPGDARVVELAAAPSDPYTLFVLTEQAEPHPIPQLAFTSSRHTLWRYRHNPASGSGVWEQRTAALPGGGIGGSGSNGYNSLGGYCVAMAVHPDNPDVLFLGGTNLYRSTNAFKTSGSTNIIGGYPYSWSDNELHPDQHALAFLPSDPAQLYVANDGGVQFTPNSQWSDPAWTNRNDGLVTSQFYRVAQDPAAVQAEFCIGGLQDNATYYSNDAADPAEWEGVIGGDGMSVAVSPGGDFVLASVYTGRVYSLLFLPNGLLVDVQFQRPDLFEDADFAFFTVFALDAFNGRTLYLGGLRALWRKDDISLSVLDPDRVEEGWSEIAAASFPDPDYVSAIGCASDASGRIYIGSSGGGLLRIDDARGVSPQVTTVRSPIFPAGGYVSCLAVDPRDHDRLFAVFSNYNVQSVFLSSDGGATWSTVSGNLEEHPDGSGAGPSVRWVVILPVEGGEILFAATSSGLFSTTRIDGMNTVWMRESPDGIGMVCVDHVDARATDGSVLVATQGSGVWAARVAGVNGIAGAINENGFQLMDAWPQPLGERLQVKLLHAAAAALTITVHDTQGRVLLEEHRVHTGGTAVHSIDTRGLPSGVCFLRVDDGTQQRVMKLLKMAL